MVEKKSNINIKDIARIAGVSITTVSHAISGKRYVKEATKRKILKIIKKYNYEPNIIARSLIKKKSSLIGVITTELNNEFYSEIIEGIENTLSPLGYILVINSSNHDPEKEISVFKKLNGLLIDGLMLIGGSMDVFNLENFNYREIPMILINRKHRDGKLPTIIIDYKKAMHKVVDHLNNIGHKNIGYVGWRREGENISREKFDGFIDGLKSNKLRVNSNNILIKDGIMYDGFKESQDIVAEKIKKIKGEKPDSITALACQTDQIALGAIKAFKKSGFKVPEDISIVGFGNISMGRFSDPALTTISVPKKEMGKIGAENFLKLYEGKTKPAGIIVLDAPLVIRDSTHDNQY